MSHFRDAHLDVTINLCFAHDPTVFFSCSNREDGERWLQMARDRLVSNALEDLTINHETEMRVDNNRGIGSRIRVDLDGHLLITVQDRVLIGKASDLPKAIGSIIRASTDGEAPINPPNRATDDELKLYNAIIAASSTGRRWAATAADHQDG